MLIIITQWENELYQLQENNERHMGENEQFLKFSNILF